MLRPAPLVLAGLALGAVLTFGLVWTAPAARAQQSAPDARPSGTPWLHVEVVEGDDDRVGINVPLAVAEIALRFAPVEKIHEKFDDKDISIVDIRAMWAELKKAGDGEFVNVDSTDESVRISREGDLLLIRVADKDGGEDVSIDAPIEVVDALLSGDGSRLNLAAAVQKLGERRGEIVRVRDGDESVRVWIDARL